MPLHIPSPSHCFYTNDRPLSISGCGVLVSSSDGPWSQLVQGFNQEVLLWTSSFWLGCKMIHPQVGKYRFPYLNFLKYEPALYLNRKLCQSFTLKNRSLSIGWSVFSLCIWISIHIKVKILITHIAHMRKRRLRQWGVRSRMQSRAGSTSVESQGRLVFDKLLSPRLSSWTSSFRSVQDLFHFWCLFSGLSWLLLIAFSIIF